MTKDPVEELALHIDAILSAYVAQEKRLRAPGWKRLFRPVPFTAIVTELTRYLADLNGTAEAVADLRKNGVLREPQRVFLETLERYCSALMCAIEKLSHIAEQLARTAEGRLDDALAGLKAEQAAYRLTVRRYMELGEQLNVLWRLR